MVMSSPLHLSLIDGTCEQGRPTKYIVKKVALLKGIVNGGILECSLISLHPPNSLNRYELFFRRNIHLKVFHVKLITVLKTFH